MRDWFLRKIEHTASDISLWAWHKRVKILEKNRNKCKTK